MDLSDIPNDDGRQDLLGGIPDAPPPQPEFPAFSNEYVDATKFGESIAYSTMLGIGPTRALENHEAIKFAFQNQMESKPMSGAGGSFEPIERNWLTEIDAAIRTGGMDTLIQYSRAARVLGVDTTDKIKSLEMSSEVWGPTKRGGWSDAIFGGVRSTVNSTLSSVPGIGIGAVLGNTVPGFGTAAGAVGGFILGPGVVFSLAEYDRFMEEAEELGLKRDDVRAEGIISGIAEGGIESLQNLVGAKVFGFIGKGFLSESAKQGLLQAFGRFLGRVGLSASVEIPGEMATAAIQNQQRLDVGIQTGMTNWEAAKSVVGSTAIQVLLTGGLMQTVAPSIESRVEPDVTVKPADMETEQAIAGAVDEKIYEENRASEGAVVEAPPRETPGMSFPEYLAVNNLAAEDISGKSEAQLSELYPKEYRSFTSPTLTEKMYQENREYKKQPIPKVLKKAASETRSSLKKAADEILGIISTRLENVNPALRTHLRNYEFSWREALNKDAEDVLPFLQAVKNMTKADYVDFDLARKNSDTTKIISLINKYGFKKEYQRYRAALDNIYKRAKEVGVDLGYIEDYHPRIVKDPKGYLKEVRNLEDWPILSQAIADKQTELGPNVLMTEEEKARIVESMIRGHKLGARPGQFKSRKIQVVTAKLNKYYESSDSALATYLRRANEHIEARKYLGRGKDTNDFTNLDDSISAYIIKQMAEGRIKPDQEAEVTDVLKARFNPKGATGAWATYRDIAYLDTMGSFISAVTQIEDLGYSFYQGGVAGTLKGIWSSLKRTPMFTRHDLGITTIAEELESTTNVGDWVRTVFKLTGLEAVDTLGKESLVQAAIEKYQARAQNEKEVNALREELLPYYESETDQLIADLKSGKATTNIKMLAFSVLSDFQPITLSETPSAYVTGGNRRLFYMLKSFVLKRLDVHRRLVIREIASGDKARAAQGMMNFLKLSAAIIACGATADEIKDWMLGRKTTYSDKVIDNILRVVGFSKYIIWTGRLEGRATALAKSVLPPFKFIDSLIKDVENWEVSETVKSIPIGGKLYYWWFGKGAEREKEKEKKERNKTLTRRKPE